MHIAICCDVRLMEIGNQAAPLELIPSCLYKGPNRFLINLEFVVYI